MEDSNFTNTLQILILAGILLNDTNSKTEWKKAQQLQLLTPCILLL